MCCLNGWGRGDVVLRRNFRLRGVGIGVVVLVGPPVGWCVVSFYQRCGDRKMFQKK